LPSDGFGEKDTEAARDARRAALFLALQHRARHGDDAFAHCTADGTTIAKIVPCFHDPFYGAAAHSHSPASSALRFWPVATGSNSARFPATRCAI